MDQITLCFVGEGALLINQRFCLGFVQEPEISRKMKGIILTWIEVKSSENNTSLKRCYYAQTLIPPSASLRQQAREVREAAVLVEGVNGHCFAYSLIL